MKRGVKFLTKSHTIFKKFSLITVILIISLVFSACNSKVASKNGQDPQLEVPTKPEYKTAKVVKGSLSRTCNGGGRMVSAFQENLSFKISDGYLRSINFQQGDKVKKGDVIAEIDCTDVDNQLKEQEVRLKIAELNYNNLVAKKADSYEIKSAALNVEIEKVEIKKLKDKLSQKSLVSSKNGVITYLNTMRIGDPVAPYTTMATISDTDHLLIEYEGEYATELKIGMKAQIEYMGKQYTGKVVSAPVSEEESNIVTGTRTVSSVFVAIDNFKNKNAVIGDTVKLYIEVMKLDNVLKVPINAVHSFNDSLYVYVLENGVKIEKTVKVGLTNYSEAQIVSGLKEGEEVIID